MRNFIVTALVTAALGVGIPLLTASSANAGCMSQYAMGGYIQACDGPIRPDGSWDRCTAGGFGGFGGQSGCYPTGGPIGPPPGPFPPDHIYP